MKTNLNSLLNVSIDDAYESTKPQVTSGNTRKKDERFWKPTLTKERKEYQACVRMLPRGLAGLENKLSPTLEQHTHYIKERVGTKPDGSPIFMSLTVKCRKSLGKNEKCPICDANWLMYNTQVKELKDKAYARRNVISHVGNFLIRNDLIQPENSGTVRLWEHTDKMNTRLLDPIRPDVLDDAVKGFKKKKERFAPYAPYNGRDFYTIVTENPSNGIASYDGSYWDEEGLTDLAPSEDEIMAILEQCHDLSEFIQNVQSPEELSKLFNDFMAKLDEKTQTSNQNFGAPTPMYVGGFQTEAVMATPAVKGNAADLVKKVKAPNPLLNVAIEDDEEPKQYSSNDLLTSDDGDDELPF